MMWWRWLYRLVMWLAPKEATAVADPNPDAKITAALAELRQARARYQHSPNHDTEFWVDQAQARLDNLLDQRLDAATIADALVTQ